MRIYREESIANFEFWGGATDTIGYLTDDEMRIIEGILEEICPDGMTETGLNDFFWFECDLIAEWLGYEDFEALMFRDHDEDDDEDEDE